jgi:hypothetical protein
VILSIVSIQARTVAGVGPSGSATATLAARLPPSATTSTFNAI